MNNITLATPANMEVARQRSGAPIQAPGLLIYSETTGERYSATPGDYWDCPQDEPLLDSLGNPMILATEHVSMRPFLL